MTCPHKSPRPSECVNKSECPQCAHQGHREWCAVLCSRCGVQYGCTCGWSAARRPSEKKIDLWNTPTTSSGKFEAEKHSGDVLRGARRDDGWSFWDVWDSLDHLHRSLLLLFAIASTGLMLHALGVFCR